MSPRDTLAADLATLLPRCAVTADGPARIRITVPNLDVVFLAVSKTGRRVEPCDSQGKAPVDTQWTDNGVLRGADVLRTVFHVMRSKRWHYKAPTLLELEALAAAGFAHEVPDLVKHAVGILEHERKRKAIDAESLRQKVAALDALDVTLSADQDAYRALLETP
jgi:hypothetical protein